MPISLSPQLMRQIIMDHYENPQHKMVPKDVCKYETIHMDSTNCIDDIVIYLLYENNIVKDCSFSGVACTISTASTDIMCSLVINKSRDEALYIIEQYKKMIHEEEYDDSVLDEAIVFMNTSKQAARIKCATIGFDGLEELLHKHEH